MPFDFNLKSSLLLFFFLHGIVFAILLLNSGLRQAQKSSLWLSLFVFLCCLYIAPFMFGYSNWYALDGYRETLFYLPLQQLFLIGPVIYFYTQCLLNTHFRLTRSESLHFLPALAYLLYALVVFTTDVFVLRESYFYANERDKDFDPWYQTSGLISMVVYFSLSLIRYLRYKNLTFQVLSYAEAVSYRWVQRFLLAFLTILILRVLFFLLNPEWGAFGSKFWYYLCFSILFYYISITGYTHAIRLGPTALPNLADFNNSHSLHTLQALNTGGILEQNPSSTPVIADLADWKWKLETLMITEKVYQNPNLTLLDIAEYLATNPRQVSQIVNQGFATNFNDFVNQYRTIAVIDKIKANEHHSKTLLALALESGFNSKSTFNRAFKKYTKLTPKEFLGRNS